MLPNIVSLSLLKNPISKVLDSAYIRVNPDNSWRIAAPFRLAHQFDMHAVHPRPDSETSPYDYHRLADTKTQYRCRFGYTGGEPGFRHTLIRAPAGMTFANGQTVETYTRIQDLIVPSMYLHSLPNDWATVVWQPTLEQHGQTYDVWVLAEGQSRFIAGSWLDQTLLLKWTVEVNNNKIRYVSSTGSNLAAGSYEAPWATVQYALGLTNSVNFVLKIIDGDHAINNTIGATVCKSIIGVDPVNRATLDTSAGGATIQADGVTFKDLNISGSPAVSGNFKAINQDGRRHRRTFHNLHFSDIVPTSFGDNSACIFTPQLGEPAVAFSEYLMLTSCTIDSSTKSQLICTFGDRYVLAEDCHGVNVNMPVSPYGAKFLHFKAQTSDVTVRHSTCSGLIDNGFINFGNQFPINCNNQEAIFVGLDYTGNTEYAAMLWNQQANGTPDKGTNQYMERCTIKGGTKQPLAFYANGGNTGGEPVNISSLLWSSTNATIWNAPNNNGVQVGTSSLKVAASDISSDYKMGNSLRAANLGYRGAEIASTLVT